jgi:hypothetical protein
MPLQPALAGDKVFIGLNSRENPISIPDGYLSKAENVRMDKGMLSFRKGLKRLTEGGLVGQAIYGSGSYINTSGQEIIVILLTDRLYTYNPDTNALSAVINYPVGVTITDASVVSMVQAGDKVYISRGYAVRALIFDYATNSVTVITSGSNQFPNAVNLLYYGNRIIAQNSVDTIAVSHYLDFTAFNSGDMFRLNDGGNDEVVGICPWTLNEFVILMRNSIFYVSVGTGAYAHGANIAADAYVKSLASDMGCSARRSAVQAAGGIIFLSDNGVYFLTPQNIGANEGIRLLTIGEPLSSAIDDVIQRINRTYSKNAIGIYWNNRYYLAVPLDSSTTNNAVLVYNFFNKAWESVDTFPAGFSIQNFIIAKKGAARRVYAVDGSQGLFLMEELEYDEYGSATGTPILPFYLPATLNLLSFQTTQIAGRADTRTYIMGSMYDKRFASLEYDLQIPTGAAIRASCITNNPDATTIVDEFGSDADGNDATRRVPIRKTAYGIRIRFDAINLRPTIRGILVNATIPGHNTQSQD